jgi:hypothetical protein
MSYPPEGGERVRQRRNLLSRKNVHPERGQGVEWATGPKHYNGRLRFVWRAVYGIAGQ